RGRRNPGRSLAGAAGILAASVLADSATEHYRGSFHNKAMFAPLAASTAALAASLHASGDAGPKARRPRDLAFAAAGLVSAAGALFHLYNVGRKPGGFSLNNLFYQAPLGAPFALMLSGGLGFLSERVRGKRGAKIVGIPAGKALGAIAAAGIAGTVAEAGFLHYRGAFQNPAMFVPVIAPPAAAAALAAATARPRGPHRLARSLLWATTAAGIAGPFFHAFGVSRQMGGWRNWRQNVLSGPPIPAPPAFTGLALVGLLALKLLEDEA
ncbi:MAG: hypothetical protein ACRED8_10305, partial [Caulobacteraceae bacterium]